MRTFPGLHAGSACEYDPKTRAFYLKETGKQITMVSCVAMTSAPISPTQADATLIECDIRRGPLNGEGRGFEVRRSLLGTISVNDLGSLWVS